MKRKKHITPMRFRTDASYEPNPPARPGDVWRIRWHVGEGQVGPIAGYAICCPGCGNLHRWTSAMNCKQIAKEGKHPGRCIHYAKRSCWDWTGSAEENTLSASPSLKVVQPGVCEWHGWLRDGKLIGA